MTFGRYVLRRTAFALVLVFVASSAALLVTLAAPSACARDVRLDDESTLECVRRAELGLDRPIHIQYFDWMRRAAVFDFRESLLYNRPVAGLVRERALNTAVLAFAALILATALGVPLGIYTGMRQHGAAASAVRVASLMMVSLPPLLAALTLMLLAARTGWLPVGGMSSAGTSEMGWVAWLVDRGRHVPLPAMALAIPLAATLERVQSEAMSMAAGAAHVRAAQARGLSYDHALLRHAWPLSLSSVLGLYGLMIGALFSGSFIVEVVTTWPGLGRLMYEGLRARDLYLVAGCAAAGALFLAIGTLVSDLLLAGADPRARLGARS
jgi:peptide/nickel transport system permease protein